MGGAELDAKSAWRWWSLCLLVYASYSYILYAGGGAGCKTPCTALLSMDIMNGRNEQTMLMVNHGGYSTVETGATAPHLLNVVARELHGFTGMASETIEHGTRSCTDSRMEKFVKSR